LFVVFAVIATLFLLEALHLFFQITQALVHPADLADLGLHGVDGTNGLFDIGLGLPVGGIQGPQALDGFIAGPQKIAGLILNPVVRFGKSPDVLVYCTMIVGQLLQAGKQPLLVLHEITHFVAGHKNALERINKSRVITISHGVILPSLSENLYEKEPPTPGSAATSPIGRERVKARSFGRRVFAADPGVGGASIFYLVLRGTSDTLYAMYKRVLLKISGEQLAGSHGFGVDPAVGRYLAQECLKVTEVGCQLILVVGGGNLVRGAEIAGDGIRRVTADQMGMLSGLINAMALTDIFEDQELPTRCMSNIFATQVAESYSYRLAEKHLERGRVTIIAGGLGRPYFTHDTAAVSLALELSCDVVIKATKVDGVYDKDPVKFPDAKLYQTLDYQSALENDAIKVMDKAALGLAMEQKMKVIVLNAGKPGNLLKAVNGEAAGTIVSD